MAPSRKGSFAGSFLAMHTIELTPDELRLVREALRAFLNDFGHEEQDVVNAVRAILAKLDAATAAA